MMLKEVRYAARMLRRSPVFTLVASFSLAIGIGGAASVFTVLNAVVLRSLPVPNPQQLYVAEKHRARDVSPRYAWTLFEQARDEVKGRAELFAATRAVGMQVRIAGRSSAVAADRGLVQLVSGEYFSVLRQKAQLGRLIEPADNSPSSARPVAIISDSYWQRQFDRDANVVGRELIIGGATLNVAGVSSPEFFGPFVFLRNPEVWVPLMLQPDIRYASNASSSDNADTRKPWAPQPEIEWLYVFARVPSSSEIAAVESALTLLHHRDAGSRLDASNAEGRQRLEAERVLLREASRGVSSLREGLTSPLLILLSMVGVLVAITCGNVASLQTARAGARERETAIRTAIGAGRWRVVRQMLIETVILSALGGVLGVLLAFWGRDALLGMFAQGATVVDLDTSFDWRVVAFSAGITIAAGVAAGLIPALRSTRVAPSDALKAQARQVGMGGGRSALVGKTLVAAQIAFCLLLLVVAGLFVRSMRSLLHTDTGFDRDQLLVARLEVRALGYADDARQALYARVLERLERVPGVVNASISLNGPLSGSERTSSLNVEGYTLAPGERLSTNEEIITDDYFETVGLRLVEGRGFGPADRQPGSRSSIINETMARRFFPSGGAVGKRWSYGNPIDAESTVVVGVVQDARYVDVKGATPNMIYRHAGSAPDEVLSSLEVRTSVPPRQLVTTVRQAITEVDPALAVYDAGPLTDRVARGLANDRLVANLTSAFGAVALVLACLGLYGTISYAVARRGRELGIRMALGADRRNVSWLVIREALVLVSAGAAVGFPLAFAASRAVASALHGVAAIDPPAYLAGAALLLMVASLAAFIPAYRASRIDPMMALRME